MTYVTQVLPEALYTEIQKIFRETSVVLAGSGFSYGYSSSSATATDPLKKWALENFERITKEVRKYGVGLMVVSQWPSDGRTTCEKHTNG